MNGIRNVTKYKDFYSFNPLVWKLQMTPTEAMDMGMKPIRILRPGGEGMRKVLALLIVSAVFALAWGGQAEAFSLGGYNGPIKIKISDYTDSSLYPNGTACATVAACDAAAASGPVAPVAGEDSWAIFQVTQILSDDGFNTVLWNSSATEQLTGIIYGILDHDVSISAAGLGYIRSIGIPDPDGSGPLKGGINVDIYLDSGSGITLFSAAGGPAARTGQGTYPTATDGSLFLSAALTPGAVAGDGVTLIDENIDQSLTFKGSGIAFADVTGGAYMSYFDTNGMVTNNLTLADLKLIFDVDAAVATFGWTTFSEDPIRAKVPEPGTLMLLGLSLAGLGGLAYRRRR